MARRVDDAMACGHEHSVLGGASYRSSANRCVTPRPGGLVMYKVLCVEIYLGKCVVRLPKWHFLLARAETGAREKLSYGGGARKITAIFNPPYYFEINRGKYISNNAAQNPMQCALRPLAALSLTPMHKPAYTLLHYPLLIYM